MAHVSAALGMSIIVSSRTDPGVVPGLNYRFVDMQELLSTADIVTLHCALTDQTAELINDVALKLMKRSAFLLNTARGGLINEAHLAAALDQGLIAGAALDVLSTEPPGASNPLLAAKNCIITPHNHWASAASRRRLLAQAVANLQAFIAGHPINVVSR